MHCQRVVGWGVTSKRAGARMWGEFIWFWHHKLTNAQLKKRKSKQQMSRKNRKINRRRKHG
jgi:hypothetical protein